MSNPNRGDEVCPSCGTNFTLATHCGCVVDRSLQSQLSQVIATLATERDAWGKRETELMRELSQAKAELEEMHKARDYWEVKAERLAEALRNFSAQRACTDDTYNGGHHEKETNTAFHHGMMTVFNVYDAFAKEALAEFEEGEKT